MSELQTVIKANKEVTDKIQTLHETNALRWTLIPVEKKEHEQLPETARAFTANFQVGDLSGAVNVMGDLAQPSAIGGMYMSNHKDCNVGVLPLNLAASMFRIALSQHDLTFTVTDPHAEPPKHL